MPCGRAVRFMEKNMNREPKLRATLMSEADMKRALKRMSHEIAEKNHGCENIVILGIKRRGMPLADILAKNIFAIEGLEVPVGELDITYYRDDLVKIAEGTPITKCEDIGVDITGKDVVLVDDVLYTGRTVRAALDAVMAHGRAATIQLAVLIDRGHRELPIRADYVGKNVPTSKNEIVSVKVAEYDGEMSVNLYIAE